VALEVLVVLEVLVALVDLTALMALMALMVLMDPMGPMDLEDLGPSLVLYRQNKADHLARSHNRRTLKLNRPDWFEGMTNIYQYQLAIHNPSPRMQHWPSRAEEGIGRSYVKRASSY
jgi:hypothetical protein